METKLNYKRTFLIGLAFLSICSFWQMYDNIIPLILQNTYHLGETMTGAVMALDNVLAIFLLPVFGTLSDKVHTKLGRRMPFIVAGTILAVIFMMMLPMIDNAEKARWATGGSFSNQVFFLGGAVPHAGVHGTVPFSGGSTDAGCDAEPSAQPRQCGDQPYGSRRRCLCPDHDQGTGGQR